MIYRGRAERRKNPLEKGEEKEREEKIQGRPGWGELGESVEESRRDSCLLYVNYI